MTLTVRKPTGLPAWPVLLLAGVEKSGKTYAAAQASASDMIGHTYWIGFGEQDPDEYGQIGQFDIVEHDGTYRDLLRAIDDVKAAFEMHLTSKYPKILIRCNKFDGE